jgi:antitoxin ChpS
MITLNVRKQGGAAVITLPSDVLRLLNIEVGDTLALDMSGNNLILHPLKEPVKRYSLTELLEGVTTQDIKELKKKTKWFREGKPKGREMA